MLTRSFEEIYSDVYYKHLIFNPDTVPGIYMDLAAECERKGDIPRMTLLFVVAAGMYSHSVQGDFSQKLAEYDKHIRHAQNRKWKQAEAEMLIRRGQGLCRQQHWGPGFEQMLKGYHLLKELPDVKAIVMIDYLDMIGTIYYEFGEYRSAINLFKQAQQLTTEAPFARYAHALNTMGLCFQKLHQYDSAYHFYTLAKEAALISEDGLAPTISGNMGVALYNMGRYEEAIPLLEEDFRLTNQWSAGPAAAKLAVIEAMRKNWQKADEYDQYVHEILDTSSTWTKHRYHQYMYEYSHYKGDYERASTHMIQAQKHKKLLEAEKDATAIKEANLKVNVERHAAEVRLLEERRERQVMIRNGLLIMIFLFGVIGYLWIRQIRERNKKKLEIAAMQAESDARRIERAEAELSQFTKALVEKNELIKEFGQQIEELQDLTATQQDARATRTDHLMQLSILTEADWHYFKQLFDEVHPGFSGRLIAKYPDLTPAENRLLTLTKLNVPTRHMANMLGISPDSVKKTRHRLRKKINLPEEGSLSDLITDV